MAGGWTAMMDHMAAHAAEPLTRHRLLLAHLDYAWDRARPRMEGVTTDEYFWEPVPGCWTLRRQPDGSFLADWAAPEPSPAPFTTIAWRLSHIGWFLNLRANHRFGDGTLTPLTAPWPGTPEAALDWMDSGFAAYRAGVAATDDASLDVHPDGPAGWTDTRFPFALNVQHITLEVIHHGAEVSLLRDLYRATRSGAALA
ncbi:MAG: DinB family protein [Acidimicrobiales bacterium]